MNIKNLVSRLLDALLKLIRPSVSKVVSQFDKLLVKLDKLIELNNHKIERVDLDLKASKQRAIDYAVKEEFVRGKLYDQKAARQEEIDRALRIRQNVTKLIG